MEMITGSQNDSWMMTDPPEAASLEPSRHRKIWIYAGSVWIFYALAIAGIVLFTKERTVTNAYRHGVDRWFNSQPLYDDSGHGFIYFPQAALTFAPWAILPHVAGEIIWRWSCIGVLGAAVLGLVRVLKGNSNWFLIASLAAVALSWTSAQAGQSTLPMTALMIFAAIGVHQKRWWLTTWLLVLGVAVKPLTMVMVLLVAAIYPQMLWRLAVGFVVLVLIPFVTQSPQYVIDQYRGCLDMLRAAYKQGDNPKDYWAQLFGMLRVFGLEVPAMGQTVARLTAALGALAACWSASRRLPSARAAWYLFALSTCYLMLFNPRTEGNTYAMVGPIYGILLAEAWFSQRNRFLTIVLTMMVIGTVGTYELTKPFVGAARATFLAPLMGIGLTILILRNLVRELKAAS